MPTCLRRVAWGTRPKFSRTNLNHTRKPERLTGSANARLCFSVICSLSLLVYIHYLLVSDLTDTSKPYPSNPYAVHPYPAYPYPGNP